MRVKAIVEFELPAGVTKQDAYDYIQESVRVNSGCLHTNDPRFGMAKKATVKPETISAKMKKLAEDVLEYLEGYDLVGTGRYVPSEAKQLNAVLKRTYDIIGTPEIERETK